MGQGDNFLKGDENYALQYVNFKRKKLNSELHFRFHLLRFEEYNKYDDQDGVLALSGRYYHKYKYWGINYGLMILKFMGGETGGAVFPMPVGGFRIGNKDNLYATCDFLKEDIYSLFSYEINYNIQKINALLYIGCTEEGIFKRTKVGLELKLLKFLHLRNSILFNEDNKIDGFKIGIGY